MSVVNPSFTPVDEILNTLFNVNTLSPILVKFVLVTVFQTTQATRRC